MSLEFGMWDSFEHQTGVSAADQYSQRIELIQTAEALDFHGYHVAEHHLSPLSMAPSPLTFLAAVARETERIRLGAMVVIVPLYPPIRLVEEICMVDALSDGRLDVGVGRGIRDVEHEWFGHDPATARERYTAAFRRVRAALATGEIEVDQPGGGTAVVPLLHSPTQPGGPRYWYVGNAALAAEEGMNVLARQPGRDEIDQFRATWTQHHLAGSAAHREPEPMIGATRPIYVAETDEEAEAVVRRSWPTLGDHFWATDTRSGGHSLNRETATGITGGGDHHEALRAGSILFGSPATVRDVLTDYLDVAGPGFNYLVSGFQWGNLTHDEAKRSLTTVRR